MRVASIGGGPAGLYLGILLKRADSRHQVTIYERNRADDTFGFGVVFSDATLGNLDKADPDSYRVIRNNFAHWDDIDIHWHDQVLRSTGHGFCGLERRVLLDILQDRCRELGVEMHFDTEVSDFEALAAEYDVVLGADGVSSAVRSAYQDDFGPDIDVRPNRFVWLGTTFPFRAFTFYFNENEHGLWRVHAYRYRDSGSTFIVECTADTFERSGLDPDDEDATIAYLEKVFARQLDGHRLIKNRSIWRNFPTVRNRSWRSGNVVLLGDAAHTAHFSIGSGTKLAMEDSIALADSLASEPSVPAALERYEARRRPAVESLQRAAQVSLEWFEHTERYRDMEPLQFAFSLMTRSLRVTHANLWRRDPVLVEAVDARFAASHGVPSRAPALVPYRFGKWRLRNRLVATSSATAVFGGQPVALVVPRVVEVTGDGPFDDVIAEARAEATSDAGEQMPVVVRVPGEDAERAVTVARAVVTAGADAVVVAAGGDDAYRLRHVPVADRVRHEVGVTTLVGGGISSLDVVSTLVAAGRVDLCLVD